jgi:hypothetical protein
MVMEIRNEIVVCLEDHNFYGRDLVRAGEHRLKGTFNETNSGTMNYIVISNGNELWYYGPEYKKYYRTIKEYRKIKLEKLKEVEL